MAKSVMPHCKAIFYYGQVLRYEGVICTWVGEKSNREGGIGWEKNHRDGTGHYLEPAKTE